MSYSIQGKVLRNTGEVLVGENYSKLNFTISDENENYPQIIEFEIFGKDKVDNFVKWIKDGDLVDVKFSLRGREYTDKKTGEIRTFNTLSAYSVYKAQTSGEEAVTPANDTEVDDDLPF